MKPPSTDALDRRQRLAARLRQVQDPQHADGLGPSALRGAAATPASLGQRRLWLLDQLGAGSAYLVGIVVRLDGVLDVEALEAGLRSIVARHQVLGACFHEQAGMLMQRPAHAPALRLPAADLSAMPAAERAAALDRQRTAFLQAPIDLSQGPPLRARLWRLAPDAHVMALAIHHIVWDGWSGSVFWHELQQAYAAQTSGQPAELPPLPLQYADFARWQCRQLDSPALQQQADFWRRALQGSPALLELPTDRPRPAQQDFGGDHVGVALGAALTAQLKALAREHEVSLFVVLLAGWGLLLSRLSGQHDVVIGTPVANRQRPEFEALIGFFANTLALRLDSSGPLDTAAWLQHVRRRCRAALANQDLPFDRVVEDQQPARGAGHAPLYQAMFSLQAWPAATLSLAGVQVTFSATPARAAPCDLLLELLDRGGELSGSLTFATRLFDRSTVQRWAGHLLTLLAGLAAGGRQDVHRLPLLTADELQALQRFNATSTPIPLDQGLHVQFEQQARRTPEAVAIVFEGQRLSYAALDRRANQLAHALRQQGAEPGELIPLLMPRSADHVAAQLAVLKAGAACVPIDPDFPLERQLFLLRDCGARRVVTAGRVAAQDHAPALALFALDAIAARLDACSPLPPGLPGRADAVAFVMYTSGSTGEPKGVEVTHQAVTRLAVNNGFLQLRPDDAVAHASNPAFDASTFELWPALLNGARVVVVPPDTVLEPARFQATLVGEGVSILWLTVGLFNQYVHALAPAFRRLRCLIVGGDVLDPGPVRHVLQHSPPQRLFNGYGPTEATTFATMHPVADVPADATAIPIGRPIANTQVHILDSHGQPVPIGVRGEIHIAGLGVARGYLHRPGLTAQRFIADPFRPGHRMVRTGDLGRWRPDGSVEYLGRNDRQIKLRGFRVEPGEIEAQLRAHPAVREAVVVAREDTPGDKRLVAYLTLPEAEALDAGTLRAHLARVLPAPMLPAAFVRLAALPLTPNGKLDRAALPAPEPHAAAADAHAAPQDPTEAAIAQTWQALLQVGQVGRHDDFFQLGGHSLLALQAVARLRESLGVDMALRDLFAHPTVSGLAAAVRDLHEQRDLDELRDPYAALAAAPAAGALRAAAPRANLVAVRPAGSQPPLFLLPGAGADAVFAHGLKASITPEVPLYALTLPGGPAGETPLPSIAVLARRCIQALRRVQPVGPVHLAGYSAGGVIALEMARQLLDDGVGVGFVGLIDSVHPSLSGPQVLGLSDAQLLLHRCRQHLHGAPDHQQQAFERRAGRGDVDALLQAAQQLGLLPPGMDRAALARECEAIRAMGRALASHQPAAVDLPVWLFAAADQAPIAGAAPLPPVGAAWQALLGSRLTLTTVGGTHETIVREPHLSALGRAISHCLQRHASAAKAHRP